MLGLSRSVLAVAQKVSFPYHDSHRALSHMTQPYKAFCNSFSGYQERLSATQFNQSPIKLKINIYQAIVELQTPQHVKKFIANKLHSSMNKQLLHVSAIIYSHLQGHKSILKDIYRVGTQLCQIVCGKIQHQYTCILLVIYVKTMLKLYSIVYNIFGIQVP